MIMIPSNVYPWVRYPFIIGAPMRVMSGAHLAVAVSRAGGLGFIGPGAKPEDTATELRVAQELFLSKPLHPALLLTNAAVLPIGVGFQIWNGDLKAAVSAVESHRPCAAWLFAPRHGQAQIDEWTSRIRKASPQTQVWVQVGTLSEAVEAAQSPFHPPDVLVLQGAEAGGHGRTADGVGLITLLPETQDKLRHLSVEIPLIAAGGIADGRGVASAMSLGAAGVAMGTRFLASTEAKISKGYQDEVVRASDGAVSTTRTHLYNHLRGTFGWPQQWTPRTIINQSWNDEQAGVPFEELQRLHDEAAAASLGDLGWGLEGRLATYAGASIGLVRNVEDAGLIVERVRKEARDIVRGLYTQMQG